MSTPPLHRRRDFSNKESTLNMIAEFLENSIQTILYHRNGYPKEVFEKHVYLGAECWKSRYKMLRTYIRQQVSDILLEIRNGDIDRVIIVLSDGDVPVECVVIDILFKGSGSIQKKLLANLLSSFLQSLSNINNITPCTTSPDLTWSLEVQCTTGKTLTSSSGWILSSREVISSESTENTFTHPIHSSSSYSLQLQKEQYQKETSIPFSIQMFIETVGG